jgi:hydroxypyruvate isomerase
MGRLSFSANLGFLWQELALPDAILAAKAAGFDAVECHWPFKTDPAEVCKALTEAGLPMLGLNTSPGDRAAGDFGLAALVGRENEAQDAIDQAVEYASRVGAGAVHVMAGKAVGEAARDCFLSSLHFACDRASRHGITILIEPLNDIDVPGYHLTDTIDAADVVKTVDVPNLKIMFDCYHVARMGHDVLTRLSAVFDHVGHIQFAGVPDRGPPDTGTLDYHQVFRGVSALGWDRPLGAEYLPGGPTGDTLKWMESLETV